MNFDWIAFCRTQHIPFVTAGPNVARNDINIRCPLCTDDPSEHMGLSKDPQRPWWGCWRNGAHRGTNPARLIMVLLRCSYEVAENLVEAGDVSKIDRFEGLGSRMKAAPEPPRKESKSAALHMPREFRPITKSGYGAAFYRYLQEDRGFTRIGKLVDRYDLRYCLTGHFRYRLIIPIYVLGELVSWTGRDITKKSAVRYRTLSDDPAKAADQGYAPARINIKSTVLNADLCRGGEKLFVCEGPFDALKLDWSVIDSNAVALFGMPESQQLAAIRHLAHGYEAIHVTLDRDAKSKAIALTEQLRGVSPIPVLWRQLPRPFKDPGELPEDVARSL